jgi:hypothetical protein
MLGEYKVAPLAPKLGSCRLVNQSEKSPTNLYKSGEHGRSVYAYSHVLIVFTADSLQDEGRSSTNKYSESERLSSSPSGRVVVGIVSMTTTTYMGEDLSR